MQIMVYYYLCRMSEIFYSIKTSSKWVTVTVTQWKMSTSDRISWKWIERKTKMEQILQLELKRETFTMILERLGKSFPNHCQHFCSKNRYSFDLFAKKMGTIECLTWNTMVSFDFQSNWIMNNNHKNVCSIVVIAFSLSDALWWHSFVLNILKCFLSPFFSRKAYPKCIIYLFMPC